MRWIHHNIIGVEILSDSVNHFHILSAKLGKTQLFLSLETSQIIFLFFKKENIPQPPDYPDDRPVAYFSGITEVSRQRLQQASCLSESCINRHIRSGYLHTRFIPLLV